MKGYCSKCFKLVDETEQLRGVCRECREKYKVSHDGLITKRWYPNE